MAARDRDGRYGAVTKTIHWTMAVLLFWQFGGMLAKVTLGREHGLTAALSANHYEVGTVLFLLAAFRVVWAAMNRGGRPVRARGFLGHAAHLGHTALYGLMIIVPGAALLRAWGGERAFTPFGVEVFAARTPETVVSWAVDLGGLIHGELGWVLGALIAGHIAMALFHQFVLRDGTLTRMTR